MRRVTWPRAAKIRGFSLNVEAHSRGSSTPDGENTFGVGGGAHFKGKVQIAPMTADDALDFQGFLHSLRGRGGTFYMEIPNGYTSNTLARFTDGTTFADNTTFDDLVAGEAGALDASAAIGATSVDIGTLSASSFAVPGAYMWIGNLGLGQLVQIVSLAGEVATIRPRLRLAFDAGAPVSVGRVTAEFRLNQNTPALPLTGFRSKDFELAIIEVRQEA